MRVPTSDKGFSLIELLVALCIIAIVCTILVPVLSNMQTQAQITTSTAMSDQLNNAYSDWKSGGGSVTGGNGIPTNADLLSVLTSAGGTPATSISAHDGYAGLSDGGTSQNIRVSAPDSLTTALAGLAGTPNAANAITAGGYIYSFDGGAFHVFPSNVVTNVSWGSPVTGGILPTTGTDVANGSTLQMGESYTMSPSPIVIEPTTLAVNAQQTLYSYDGNNYWKIVYSYFPSPAGIYYTVFKNQ